ncbi:MAG: LysR family transcriptional regulator [Xanthobacteraceae bacterium]|nr:LysR family transcriptional regulator [Xanthobacteraceae bacterium]
MDHRGLNAFLAIARLGSVGAAASALSLTQPAVSRTLRKLEQDLGVQLFLRHSTGMELTAFGQSLLPHATSLETGLHRALEEIDLLRGTSKGSARVGILPSLVPDILPIVLNRVRLKLPGIQLHIVEAPNHQLTRALLRGEIDFALAAAPPDLTEDNIRVTPLVNDEICIVTRAAHPIAKKKSPTQKDLREYSWALQERGGLIWRRFQTLFANANLDLPPVTLTANSIQTLKSVVVSSDLITMLPRMSIWSEEKNKILRPVPLSAARWKRQLAVLRRPNAPVLPVVTLVLTEFRKALTETATSDHSTQVLARAALP